MIDLLEFFATVLCLLIMGCKTPNTVQQLSSISPVQPLNTDKELSTIAFGSCNHQHEAQPMWQHILENQPELWIWLGDNIYGDTEDMEVMAKKYQQQVAH